MARHPAVRLSGSPLRSLFRLAPFLLVFLAAAPAAAQSVDEVSRMLNSMSPSEIEQQLRVLGISREEAVRRAGELGVDLEQYLRGQVTTRQATQQAAPVQEYLFVDPRLRQNLERQLQRSANGLLALDTAGIFGEADLVRVPGFDGRPGIDSTIQPFGMSIFSYPRETFEPSLNVATPTTYALGGGDELVVTMWGDTRITHRLVVNREGNVLVPDVGPVSANGLTIQQFRDRLLRRMSSIYSGLKYGAPTANTFLDVSLGKLKTIQVFVLGDVRRPGGYPLTSMSTGLHALFEAGGPTGDGSLRDIRVVRPGDSVHSVDIYDFVLRGDRTRDLPLQDGDVLFVPPAARRVAVVGNVVRPAIYEIRDGERLGDLVRMAGGVRFTTQLRRIHLERIVPFAERKEFGPTVIDRDFVFRDLDELQRSGEELEDGDILTFYRVNDRPMNRVIISGHVNNPGPVEWKPGMRVRDLIFAADSLRRSAFMERGTLYRLLPNLRREVLSFEVRKALQGVPTEDHLLLNEDSVVVYPENQFFPERFVSIYGSVRKPGSFRRMENLTVADLVVLAGGLTEGASRLGWEISRLDTTQIGRFRKVFTVDIDEEYWRPGGGGAFVLHDFDAVFVPSDPRYTETKTVQIAGYVMYPGTYTITSEGERLSDLFRRAGGLRHGAYPEGSRLIRMENGAGLVPVNFREALDEPASRENIVLRAGDSIHVPMTEDLVYVTGEVYVPSPVVYKRGASLSYYIEQAGDYTTDAEDGKTVVFLPGGKKWDGGEILAGSSIFVPKEIVKEDKLLPFLRDTAAILASIAALTVALIQVTK